MRSLMTAVFAFILATLAVLPSAAHAASAVPIRVVYSSTNVTTSAYVQLVASTVKGLKGYTVWNSGSAPVEIAFGAAGSEVVQTIHPMLSSSAVAPVVYPVPAGYGTRISVISLTQTNSTGELQVNLIYN